MYSFSLSITQYFWEYINEKKSPMYSFFELGNMFSLRKKIEDIFSLRKSFWRHI